MQKSRDQCIDLFNISCGFHIVNHQKDSDLHHLLSDNVVQTSSFIQKNRGRTSDIQVLNKKGEMITFSAI